MPYTKKQNRLFRAAEHDPEIAAKHGMSQAQAGRMAREGVKHNPEREERKAQKQERRAARKRKATILYRDVSNGGY